MIFGIAFVTNLVVLYAIDRWRQRQAKRARRARRNESSRALALEAALVDVAAEIQRARMQYPPFRSAHEGYAVALEEVDELKAHVWCKQSKRDLDAMRTEAIQAAASFASFAAECCGEESGRV